MQFDENHNKGNNNYIRGVTQIMDTFECIDAFINNQDAYDNAMASLQNSNASNFSQLDQISMIQDNDEEKE